MVEGIEVYPKFEKGFDWSSPSTDYAHYDDPDAQPYHGAWWGGNFRGARDYPVDLGEYQSQLVYSPHDYGPLVWEQEWFKKDFTRETLLEDYWYDTWAYLVEENISPLLMGEWGGFIGEKDPTGDNTKWMTILRDYMIEKRIHHTFWCFNENSGDTGGLIASDTNWTEWDLEKYALVKPSLWADSNGKFISLDHKIPLGQSGNGISLSDYYSGSSQQTTTSATQPVTEKSEAVILGDCNDDKIVNTLDSVVLRKYLFSEAADSVKINLTNADMNTDTKVNAADLVSLHKFLIGR